MKLEDCQCHVKEFGRSIKCAKLLTLLRFSNLVVKPSNPGAMARLFLSACRVWSAGVKCEHCVNPNHIRTPAARPHVTAHARTLRSDNHANHVLFLPE
jgi:hypothetical protein